MDLLKMEEKLDNGEYQTFNDFRNDFKLIVNNCRLYNGQNNGKRLFICSHLASRKCPMNMLRRVRLRLIIFSFLSFHRIHRNGK